MRVLGVVMWTSPDKAGYPVAGVRPLYEVQKSDWREINASEEFPTRGQVFWPSAQTATEDSLVFFRTEENPNQKDVFKVVDPKLVAEVIDLRALGGPAEARAALARGLRRQGTSAGRVLVWCQPSQLIGPVEVVRTPTGMLKLVGSNLAKVSTFAAAEPRRVHDGRHERLLRMEDDAPTGYVDWDDDAAILKRALHAAVRLAKQTGKDTGQTKRQIEEAAEALAAQSAGGPDAQLDLYRLERARALCRSTALVAKLAPDVVDALRTHPSVSDQLARLESEIRGTVEAAARADVEQKLAEERRMLQELSTARDRAREERAAEERRLDELRREFEAIKGRASQAAQEVEEAIGHRVRSALERPAELLAEAAVIRPLLAPTQQVPGKTRVNEAAVSQRTSLPWSRARGEILEDRPALQKALTAAARARGVAPASMLQLHAAVAAELVPVVLGSRALAGLAAYAHAVCGARLGVLHISPAFIQPLDLLGSTLAGSFEPHPTGLISAAAAAQGIDGVSLLALEGANRSPLESSLIPLLQLREAGLGVAVPPHADDVRLPAGLRLAATFIAGATTVPVTPQLWCHAVALTVEPTAIMAGGADAGELPLASDLFALGAVPGEIVDGLVEAWPDGAELRPALERYGAALSNLYSDSERVRIGLLEGILLPFIVTALGDEEQEEAVKRLSGATDSGLDAVAHRLRRRLR